MSKLSKHRKYTTMAAIKHTLESIDLVYCKLCIIPKGKHGWIAVR